MSKKKIIILISILTLLFSACPLEEGISAITCEAEEIPAIEAFHVLSKNSIKIKFTGTVNEVEIVSEPDLGFPEIVKSGTEVEVIFPQNTEVGKKYIISGSARAGKVSTLDFELNILGFNDRVPGLFINEIRTDYSKPKAEFIEFRSLSDGNLSGVTVEIASAEEEGIYIFPPVEIQKGDYITLHLIKLTETEGALIEDDLLSKTSGYCGTDTNENAWDFWVETDKKLLRKSDVIILYETKEGKIIDGAVMTEGNISQWKSEILANKALCLVNSGIWGPDEKNQNGIYTTTEEGSNLTTTTRTLGLVPGSETILPRTKEMWQVCDAGDASPGSENSTSVYEQ